MDIRLSSKPVLVVRQSRLQRKCYGSLTFTGGGRGMRVVREGDSLEAAVTAARSEALSAFGNDAVFLERWVHVHTGE